MDFKAALTIALSVLFFAAFASAQVPDLNAMTDAQIAAYIQILQQQAIQANQQPQVVNVELDTETKNLMKALQTEMSQVKQSNSQLEARFAQLVTNTERQIETAEKNITIEMEGVFSRELMFVKDDLKSYILAATNPVRTSIPLIAVFAMLAGAFMLWAAKYFTGGVKRG